MSYMTKPLKSATPTGLARLYDGSSTTPSVNGVHLWGSLEDLHGSGTCTVSSGVISLPSGYKYLLQASTAPGGSSGYYLDLHIQFYDENSSSYIGTKGFNRGGLANNQDIYQDASKDETARVWVDASSSSASVSLRFQSLNGFNSIDSTQRWNGFSRCLVWRFT